jgi:alpha-L-fucosidase 2
MKEAALFYLDALVEQPKTGWLVMAPDYSPENTFKGPDGKPHSMCVMPTMTIGVVHELFVSCIEASKVLGVDPDLRAELEQKLAKLPPLQVGKSGGLQEWLEDFDEIDPGQRHNSHLFPLFPGQWITPKTEALFEAARVAVRRRIDSGGGWTGWSRAWLINCAARLGDADMAHECVLALLRRATFPNLFDAHPRRGGDIAIFQIDGNFGGAAGIAEMLLQSHTGEIHLLPALPKQWPRGHIRGLRARGGYEVSIVWSDAKLKGAKITASLNNECTVRGAGPFEIRHDGKAIASSHPDGLTELTSFPTRAGETYDVVAHR